MYIKHTYIFVHIFLRISHLDLDQQGYLLKEIDL